MSALATASIRIGRWEQRFRWSSGAATLLDSSLYARLTVYKLIPVELRIYRLYFAPPEHTTESTANTGSYV